MTQKQLRVPHLFCLHESQTDSWVSLQLIVNHRQQAQRGGEGLWAVSGLE